MVQTQSPAYSGALSELSDSKETPNQYGHSALPNNLFKLNKPKTKYTAGLAKKLY